MVDLKKLFSDLESQRGSKNETSTKIGMMAQVSNRGAVYPDASDLARIIGVVSTSKVGSIVKVIDKEAVYNDCPQLISNMKNETDSSTKTALSALLKEWESGNGGRYKCLNGDKAEVIAAGYDYSDVGRSNDSENTKKNTQGWLSWITSLGSQEEPKVDDPYQGKKPILAIRMMEPAEPKIILIGEQGVKFDGSFPHGLEWKVGNSCYNGDVGEVIAAGKSFDSEFIAIRIQGESLYDQKIVIIGADAVSYMTKTEYDEDQVSLARIQNWNDDFDYKYPDVKIDPDSF